MPWRKKADKRKKKNLIQDISDVTAAYVKYGIAVPTSEVLSFIKTAIANRSLIELGSGLGYMSSLLQQRGVQVTAVDYLPYSSTEKHMKLAAEVNEFPQPPELYHPTVKMTADMYMHLNDHAKGAAILLINFPDDPLSWLWRYDWNLFQGEVIIVSFIMPERADRFETLIKSYGWFCDGYVVMPKWDVMTPERSQRVQVFYRSPQNQS